VPRVHRRSQTLDVGEPILRGATTERTPDLQANGEASVVDDLVAEGATNLAVLDDLGPRLTVAEEDAIVVRARPIAHAHPHGSQPLGHTGKPMPGQ